jgi:D-alanine-D-alanine ligase
MKIGLTYDLRDEYLAAGYTPEETAELDRPDTIQGIEDALGQLGFQTERIGSGRRLAEYLVHHAAKRDTGRCDMVFNIAEGLSGVSRESQVPTLLELYGVPYTFSDPAVLLVALNKALAKMVVRAAGLATPDFVEIQSPAQLDAVRLAPPLFAKPVAEGSGKGIAATSKVDSPAALKEVVVRLLAEHHQSVLVETYLPGAEYTVGVAGTGSQAEVLGVMAVRFNADAAGIYSYHTKTNYERLVDYRLVSGAEAEPLGRLALAAWRAVGCRDGGRLDIRLAADGTPHFLEVNPLAGLNPTYSDLPMLCRLGGISYVELIAKIMRSALGRAGLVHQFPAGAG